MLEIMPHNLPKPASDQGVTPDEFVTSKFFLYFSSSCIHTNESLFIYSYTRPPRHDHRYTILYLWSWCNIWTTRASVSPGYPNTRKQCMKSRARSASVFIHCFRVFGYPGETRARVVYMASQMNRDVTECYRLLIWIEFLTKHNVIRNSIQVILHA
jgi:hypothetical protein